VGRGRKPEKNGGQGTGRRLQENPTKRKNILKQEDQLVDVFLFSVRIKKGTFTLQGESEIHKKRQRKRTSQKLRDVRKSLLIKGDARGKGEDAEREQKKGQRDEKGGGFRNLPKKGRLSGEFETPSSGKLKNRKGKKRAHE